MGKKYEDGAGGGTVRLSGGDLAGAFDKEDLIDAHS